MNDRKQYFLEYSRKKGKSAREKARQTIFTLLGGPVCNRCGFSDMRALQIDHIEGGGNKARMIDRHHGVLISQVKGRPEGFQVLCANCNWIKRVENNEIGRLRFK